MILVDTSIWIDHLRREDPRMAALLQEGRVLAHPFVTGEITLGHLRQRDIIIFAMQRLPQAEVARDSEVLRFIGEQSLFGTGIGYVDAHLLAATRLTQDATLWTRDRKLESVAERLRLAARVVN